MTDSLILANRRAYDRSSPQRGDIIVFETDQSESKLLVKRVVATEGETVELRNGAVSVSYTHLDVYKRQKEALRRKMFWLRWRGCEVC